MAGKKTTAPEIEVKDSATVQANAETTPATPAAPAVAEKAPAAQTAQTAPKKKPGPKAGAKKAPKAAKAPKAEKSAKAAKAPKAPKAAAAKAPKAAAAKAPKATAAKAPKAAAAKAPKAAAAKAPKAAAAKAPKAAAAKAPKAVKAPKAAAKAAPADTAKKAGGKKKSGISYDDLVAKTRKVFGGKTVSKKLPVLPVNIILHGAVKGTFYILISAGKITVEPYRYEELPIDIAISADNFNLLLDGKYNVAEGIAASTFEISVDDLRKAIMAVEVLFR
jgi:hypothetical protein